MKKYKFFIMIFICLAIIFAGYLVFIKNDKVEDLSEIEFMIDTYKSEFKSERGFGNDRFDIYSFSLKNTNDEGFKFKDVKIEEYYKKNIKSMIDAKVLSMENKESSEANKLKKLEEEIKKIYEQKDTGYKLVEIGGTKKLYLYSKSLNKGYCLIITI